MTKLIAVFVLPILIAGSMYVKRNVQGRPQAGGSKTFTVAGNGTSLNQFTVPAGFTQLTVRAWGGGAGGGGGAASRGNSNNTGYGGGGGAAGDYATVVLSIVPFTPPSPSSIAGNTLLTIDVGVGGSGGIGASISANSTAKSGKAGTITKVTKVPAFGTVFPTVIKTQSAIYEGGGGGTTTGGIGGGGASGFTCTQHGSDTYKVGGGNGGSGCSGGGAGGSGGLDPGCNNAGKNGSDGTAPGGAGGGGSGGRTCGLFGGRHSAGNGGNGANGQVTITWK